MNRIFEQSEGRGKGYELPDFLDRFGGICAEHLRTGRAKAFAFVLYDFQDASVRNVLKDEEGFLELDRLSGTDLSVFYLHETDRDYVPKFNAKFLQLLGVAGEARTPCVVFFRMENGRIADTSVANLDSRNLLISFHELYDVLERFRDKAGKSHTKVLRIIAATAKSVGLDTVSGLLAEGLESLM
jgi:hypothetical protein